MARIVFVSWWWPYPADNGAKLRVYHLLRELSRKHDVTLLSFAEPGEAAPEQMNHLREFCIRVECVPKPHYQPSTLKATLGYLSRWPRSLVDVYSPAMATQVRAAVEKGVDVLIASELQTMRYLELARHIPAVLEEAEITVFQDRVARAARSSSRLRAQLTLSKLENALRSLLERGVAITVVSDAEQEYIRRFAPSNATIAVVPNGVDTITNRPNPDARPEPYTLVYSGAVTYSANLDAVTFFVRDVWPLVRARAPEAQFTVTGGTGKVDVSALAAQPGVTFTGYVPEIAPILQNSWALVVPLREGGGTRLKILEAMALGLPVISTSKGAEGLNVWHGEDILIADQPAQMADAIRALFDDPALRARLAANARALVEREYDWSVIGQRLLAVIDSLKKM
ncbi:MAG: glycosyltransferase [Chloroflexi bacterium]|nr:glycosyltransferase [Chloroflexota bacterium]